MVYVLREKRRCGMKCVKRNEGRDSLSPRRCVKGIGGVRHW